MMQKAFGLFELILVFNLIGILIFFTKPTPMTQVYRTASYLYQNILYTKNLALTQSTYYSNLEQTQWLTNQFPSIYPQILLTNQTFWQIQFHLSGKYTQSSFSIYLDTPRRATTTHYDNRPMAGDVIATEGFNLRCITGYNNTNTADFCKNNTDSSTRVLESYGVKITLSIQKTCEEKQTARIYFDNQGKPYCGKIPQELQEPFVLKFSKKDIQTQLCILPKTGAILKGTQCQKI